MALELSDNMTKLGSSDVPGCDDAGSDAVPCVQSSYPGGKSGPGIYQRLINLIPCHKILIVGFAGQCGVTRNIVPAEHTIIIDRDEKVCDWWDNWRRTKKGRALEIHHCDSIEWLRYYFGLTEYSAQGSCDDRSTDTGSHGCRTLRRPVMTIVADQSGPAAPTKSATSADAALSCVGRLSPDCASEAFVFLDPPYVLSERSHGRRYAHELTDDDHTRMQRILTLIPPTEASIMVCGYDCRLYAMLDPWRSIDHRVPTRGGLQDERIWMNYSEPKRLHDYRYIGDDRRDRERIRRRQRNWVSQLRAMCDRERSAMLVKLSTEDSAPTKHPTTSQES